MNQVKKDQLSRRLTMKKIIKLIISSVITLSLVLTFAIIVKANTPVTTTNLLSVEGDQVRTETNPGIRFVGKSTYEGTFKEYGIAIALGEVPASEVVLGATDVHNAAVNSLDEEGRYYLTIYGVPQSFYTTEITARAYVVLEDDSVVYAETALSRSLAEVSLLAKNVGTEGEIIETVNKYISENYVKVHQNAEGYVVVDAAIWESNPAKLKEAFIADWNTALGDSLTIDDFVVQSGNGSGFRTAATFETFTEAGITRFFQHEVYGTKWNWLLNYITSELPTNDYALAQIKAIQSNVEDSDNWHNAYHLTSFILSILNGKYSTTGYSGYNFSKNPDKYSLITKYNNTVYADVTDAKLVKVGETFSLPEALTPATGYKWDGYYLGTTPNEAGATITVSSLATNSTYAPTTSLIEYTIKYMDGSVEIFDLTPTTYNVNTDSFALPEISKDDHLFRGWYVQEDFSGAEVTSIEKGSTGNKVFYAQFEAAQLYNITYNFDGGNSQYTSREQVIKGLLEDFNEFTGKSYTADTLTNEKWTILDWDGFFTNIAYKGKWMWLVNYFVDNGGSKIIPSYKKIVDGKTLDTSTDPYAIAYEVTAFIKGIKNTVHDGFVSADYSTPAKADGFWSYLAEAQETSYQVLSESTLLPAYKKGYNFLGWYESADFTGSPVTVATKDMTLYAKWESANPIVTYSFNGGSLTYETRQAMIDAFLTDYNTFAGTEFTTPASITGHASLTLFWKNTDMRAKWLWIWSDILKYYNGDTQYINNIINSANWSGYAYQNLALYFLKINADTWNANYKGTYADLSSIHTCGDFTNLDDNGFRQYIAAQENTQIFELGTTYTLPTEVYKDGYTFAGWYLTADCTGEQVTTVSSTCTVYAKWIVE